jgi:DNA polymerase III epsilon subunit-like protein
MTPYTVKMKAIIFDIETTGLPKMRNPPVNESWYWPYIVQISWMVFDIETKRVEKVHDYIIKLPDKISIPDEVVKIHGITKEISNKKGISIKKALAFFTHDLTRSNFLVAHNINFDDSIVRAEYHRNGLIDWLGRYRGTKICTMKLGMSLCPIKHIHPRTGNSINKYPKLIELHEHLFESRPQNLHNSLIDVYVCFRCFYQLIYENDYNQKNPVFSRRYNILSSI